MDDEFYTQGNKQYERVTRVINYFCPPELVDYRIRVGNRVANAAMKKGGKFGAMIDEAIRKDWQNPTVEKISSESENAIKAWTTWAVEHSLDVFQSMISFPETYYSDALLVAGTPDFIWGKMIVDIKTSNRISPIYFAQLGAYAFLSGLPIEDLAVLRLDKSTGLYEFVKASEMGLSVGDCINWFNALLITYRNYKQVQSTLKGKEVCNGRDNDTW